jgi:hypothetical protein
MIDRSRPDRPEARGEAATDHGELQGRIVEELRKRGHKN